VGRIGRGQGACPLRQRCRLSAIELRPALSPDEALRRNRVGPIWLRVAVRRGSYESIDLDRSRKVTSGRIARKPAPMLMPDGLTVKVTVKGVVQLLDAIQINSLERSLMIEWE